MYNQVLKLKKIKVLAAVFFLSLCALTAACVVRQVKLAELKHVIHKGTTPFLKMGKMVQEGMECTDCHKGALTGARAGMPDREFCMDCHEDLDDKEDFALGGPHYDKDGKAKWHKANLILPEGLKFAHSKHTGTHKCEVCHGDIANDDYSLVDLAPRIENCRRCHLQQENDADCGYCHAVFDRTQKPHNHDRSWGISHGRHVRYTINAGSLDKACSQCHTDTTCLNCHQEQKPRDHSNFFCKAGHSISAGIDRDRCATCHTQDRCIRCHTDQLAKAPARPATHPGSTVCLSCHSGVKQHLTVSDNCTFCHK